MKISDVALILIRLLALYTLLGAFGILSLGVTFIIENSGGLYTSQFFVMTGLSLALWFIAPFVAMLMVKKIEKPLNDELFNSKYQVETTIFTVIGLVLVITSIAPMIFQLAYNSTDGIGYIDETQKAMVQASRNGIAASYVFKLIIGILLIFFSESFWKFIANTKARLLK